MLRHQHLCSSYVINPTFCEGIGGAVKRFSGYYVPVTRDPKVVAATEIEGSTSGLRVPLGTTTSTHKSFEETAQSESENRKLPVAQPDLPGPPAPAPVQTLEGDELELLKETAKETAEKKSSSPKAEKRKPEKKSDSPSRRKKRAIGGRYHVV